MTLTRSKSASLFAPRTRELGSGVSGGRTCCVPNCFNHTVLDRGLKFYTFPSDLQRRILWLERIGRPQWIPGAGDMVCGNHFVGGRLRTAGGTEQDPTIFPRVKTRRDDSGGNDEQSGGPGKRKKTARKSESSSTGSGSEEPSQASDKVFEDARLLAQGDGAASRVFRLACSALQELGQKRFDSAAEFHAAVESSSADHNYAGDCADAPLPTAVRAEIDGEKRVCYKLAELEEPAARALCANTVALAASQDEPVLVVNAGGLHIQLPPFMSHYVPNSAFLSKTTTAAANSARAMATSSSATPTTSSMGASSSPLMSPTRQAGAAAPPASRLLSAARTKTTKGKRPAASDTLSSGKPQLPDDEAPPPLHKKPKVRSSVALDAESVESLDNVPLSVFYTKRRDQQRRSTEAAEGMAAVSAATPTSREHAAPPLPVQRRDSSSAVTGERGESAPPVADALSAPSPVSGEHRAVACAKKIEPAAVKDHSSVPTSVLKKRHSSVVSSLRAAGDLHSGPELTEDDVYSEEETDESCTLAGRQRIPTALPARYAKRDSDTAKAASETVERVPGLAPRPPAGSGVTKPSSSAAEPSSDVAKPSSDRDAPCRDVNQPGSNVAESCSDVVKPESQAAARSSAVSPSRSEAQPSPSSDSASSPSSPVRMMPALISIVEDDDPVPWPPLVSSNIHRHPNSEGEGRVAGPGGAANPLGLGGAPAKSPPNSGADLADFIQRVFASETPD
ncbi:uncharacterized protein LOC135829700 [Sycon ciliatum]|uniref:uncharacterized protein LOC135829700 n=1 Tax=Sycon ciliatum TaxID=27933 RepID=UPI0020AE0AA6